jgi:hypothetical protein
MDFLCPSCQQLLKVADQYAGTMMQCPLCAGKFQAPALAPQPVPLPAVAPSAPAAPDVYGVKEPPPAPVINSPPAAATTAKAPAPTPKVPPPQPPVTSPGEYQHAFALGLNTQVIPWLAPGALILVVLLQLFFAWVGMYPGGYAAYTQGSSAALGWFSRASNPIWEKVPAAYPSVPAVVLGDKASVSMSVPLLFYVLLLLPVTILAIAAAVFPQLTLKLPPIVGQIAPWRWALVAAAALFLLLLLLLPVLFGFSLEEKITAEAKAAVAKDQKDKPTTDEDKVKLAMAEDSAVKAQVLQRTTALHLVVLLQLVAVIGAALQFWLDRRGAQPVPRVEFRW